MTHISVKTWKICPMFNDVKLVPWSICLIKESLEPQNIAYVVCLPGLHCEEAEG